MMRYQLAFALVAVGLAWPNVVGQKTSRSRFRSWTG